MMANVNKNPTSAAASIKRKTPVRLERLGARLADLRKRNGLGKQSDIADRLAEVCGRNISQSLVAQIEKGKLTNPDATLLRDLAKVYGARYEDLVADFNIDKLEISPFKASFLARDILDLHGLAQWEDGLPHKSVLWIAAPNFVDDKDKEMRDVVVGILMNGGKVVYFVDERDTGPGRKFETLKSEFAQHSGLRGTRVPEWTPLNSVQVSVLRTGFVIANPEAAFGDNPKAEGYLIINAPDGTPEFGINMALQDIQQSVTLLKSFMNVVDLKLVVERDDTHI